MPVIRLFFPRFPRNPSDRTNPSAGPGRDFRRFTVLALALTVALMAPVAAVRAHEDLGDAPDSYGTDPLGPNGFPRHVLGFPANPRLTLGPTVDYDCLASCSDSLDSPDALGDDNDHSVDTDNDTDDDEDGITLPPLDDPSAETYTVTAQVLSLFMSDSFQLCGWIDFDISGTFDTSERTCALGSVGDACAYVGDTVIGGQVKEEFSCELVFDLPDALPAEDTFARFRLCTTLVAEKCDTPTGLARAGEVEDYLITAGTLPVSLNSFDSRILGTRLYTEWTTASETFNIGFRLFARVSGEWRLLTDPPVRSRAPDSVTPQRYRERVRPHGFSVDDIEALALASLDTTGREAWYGPFEIGESYGEQAAPKAIDWGAVRRDTVERMGRLGFADVGARLRARGPSRLAALLEHVNPGERRRLARWRRFAGSQAEARVTVVDPGMQRVSYESLAAAGVDLRGVPIDAIAVAYKNDGVPRIVRSRDRRFGPGDAIDFWGEAPAGEDALYIDARVYRVVVDRELARGAIRVNRPVGHPASHYLAPVVSDRPLRYLFSSSTGDPWVEGKILSFGSPSSGQYTLSVGRPVLGEIPGRVSLRLGGLTDWPEGADDHHVQVRVNGELVADVTWDGITPKLVDEPVPGGVIVQGANTVTLTVPGDTGHDYDGVIVDRIALGFPTELTMEDGRAVFDDTGEDVHDGFFVSGAGVRFPAFAMKDGNLAELRGRGVAGGATFPAVADGGARYWISRADALHVPAVHRAEEADPLPERADYLLVVHPSFLPEAGDHDHPLSRYLAAKREEGWNPAVIDTETIFTAYGWDMPLPDAITRMLAAADERFAYGHVLLVGGDCYDYLDHLGTGCVSFVPTRYGPTSKVLFYTPSDGLLADLDGDEVADKAIGRWPVRTLEGLAAVVDKTLAWSEPVGGMRYARSAVWATDTADPRAGSFVEQAERMIARLREPLAGGSSEPWPADGIDRVYLDWIANELPADEVLGTARERLVGAINAGRTLTGFVGHGSPASWTFQNLFTSSVAAGLVNGSRPTQVVTLTCYTTYFVSPGTDTLAHQLLTSSHGGAVAVHGAAALSGYALNEALAGGTLDQQLMHRETIGNAIRNTRSALMASSPGTYRDVSINWSLLGDPTLLTGLQP